MIGGGIGSFLGPWGAVVGATVGHFMVDRRSAGNQKKEATRLMALIAGALHELACCDRAYSKDEDNAIRAILSDFNARLGAVLDMPSLIYLIDDARRIDSGVGRLALKVRPHPELAHEALRWLWHVALADGALTAGERKVIDHFVHIAQVPPQEADFIATQFIGHAGAMDEPYRSACDVLGVAYDVNLEAIKQAYRTLSLKYHPDKHADLDPDIRALTAEKFSQIKEAYDVLVKLKSCG